MQTKNLIFDVPYAIIGTWTESHELSGNATDMRIFCTSFTGGSGNNQYPRASLSSAFSATSGLSEKGRKHEKKELRMKQITLHKIVDSSNCSPVITIKNGHATTTSRNVAIVFGKRHDRVIDAIRNLTTSTPTEFSQHNFVSAAYRDNSGKSNPMYELTRDGFTLLAMGFTGKRALEFKLAYINAFNEMERKLAEPKTITVKSHTRKLPSKAPQPKSKVLDVEACGIPVCEQMPIAGAMWDFMRGAQSVAELDKRRDYMMRGIINMHAHNSMRLQGLQGLIKEVR